MSLTRFQRSFYVQNDGPSRLLSRQTHTTWPKSASTIFPFPLLPSKDCFWIESSLTHSLSKAYSPSSLIPFLSQQKHRQYSRRDSRKPEKLNRFVFSSPIQTEPYYYHSPFRFLVLLSVSARKRKRKRASFDRVRASQWTTISFGFLRCIPIRNYSPIWSHSCSAVLRARISCNRWRTIPEASRSRRRSDTCRGSPARCCSGSRARRVPIWRVRCAVLLRRFGSVACRLRLCRRMCACSGFRSDWRGNRRLRVWGWGRFLVWRWGWFGEKRRGFARSLFCRWRLRWFHRFKTCMCHTLKRKLEMLIWLSFCDMFGCEMMRLASWIERNWIKLELNRMKSNTVRI